MEYWEKLTLNKKIPLAATVLLGALTFYLVRGVLHADPGFIIPFVVASLGLMPVHEAVHLFAIRLSGFKAVFASTWYSFVFIPVGELARREMDFTLLAPQVLTALLLYLVVFAGWKWVPVLLLHLAASTGDFYVAARVHAEKAERIRVVGEDLYVLKQTS